MFQEGDLVIYGSDGVCRIESVGSSPLPGADKNKLYYTLRPLCGSGRISAPVEGKVFMRPVISRDEALSLIDSMPQCAEDTPADLAEFSRIAFESHDCRELARLIFIYTEKKTSVERLGKRLGIMDERSLKRAESLLYGELAAVLGIEKNDVPAFIKDRSENVGVEAV